MRTVGFEGAKHSVIRAMNDTSRATITLCSHVHSASADMRYASYTTRTIRFWIDGHYASILCATSEEAQQHHNICATRASAFFFKVQRQTDKQTDRYASCCLGRLRVTPQFILGQTKRSRQSGRMLHDCDRPRRNDALRMHEVLVHISSYRTSVWINSF